MTDKIKDRCKMFENAIMNSLRNEKMQHFRLCIDEKDNISIASGPNYYSNLSGTFVPKCPIGTEKTLEVVITPIIEEYDIINGRLIKKK
jgi:hypothetical protein